MIITDFERGKRSPSEFLIPEVRKNVPGCRPSKVRKKRKPQPKKPDARSLAAARRRREMVVEAVGMLGSDVELAKRLGVTAVAVSGWRRGLWSVSARHVEILSRIVGGGV